MNNMIIIIQGIEKNKDNENNNEEHREYTNSY